MPENKVSGQAVVAGALSGIGAIGTFKLIESLTKKAEAGEPVILDPETLALLAAMAAGIEESSRGVAANAAGINALLAAAGEPPVIGAIEQIPFTHTLTPGETLTLREYAPFSGYLTFVTIHWPDGCFIPDTPILMGNGLEKAIQDISCGEEVLCHSSYGKVTETYKRQYSGEIITIKPRGLDAISVTPDHPFLAISGKDVAGCGGKPIIPFGAMWHRYRKKPSWVPKWIAARDLKAGDWLVSPICDKTNGVTGIDITQFTNFIGYSRDEVWGAYNVHHLLHGVTKARQKNLPDGYVRYKSSWCPIPRYIEFTPDFMRLLGLYLAEGSPRNVDYNDQPIGITFSFGNHEKELINNCLALIRNCFGINGYMYVNHNTDVHISSVPIALLFKKLCGEHSDRKTIHPVIMQQKPELQWHLINGLHDGDNSDGRGRNGILLRNPSLISQIATILNRLRLKPAIAKSGKAKVVYWGVNNHYKSRFYLNNWLMTPIRQVKSYPYAGPVYNLEVSAHNSYTAGKIAVHNCNAKVDVAVVHGLTQFSPREGYLALNDTTPTYPFGKRVHADDHEEIRVKLRNRGLADHTITVSVIIEEG